MTGEVMTGLTIKKELIWTFKTTFMWIAERMKFESIISIPLRLKLLPCFDLIIERYLFTEFAVILDIYSDPTSILIIFNSEFYYCKVNTSFK